MFTLIDIHLINIICFVVFHKTVCMAMAISLHYALTALFCWMLVEGFHLYILLVKVFKRANHLIRYLVFGWGKSWNRCSTKYKEGNKSPSSVNQISLVHNYDKARNKCYPIQHEHSGNPCVWIGSHFTIHCMINNRLHITDKTKQQITYYVYFIYIRQSFH